MVEKTGPAQRLPSNIIKIQFPSVGGLLFLRINQSWTGNVAPPVPSAGLRFGQDLPWASFDMFSASATVDPDDKSQDKDAPIGDPVTDKMLHHWNYWPPKDRVNVDTTTVGKPIDVVVVDLANWANVYNHVLGSMISPLMTRDEALSMYKTITAGDPDLVGVALVNNDGSFIVIPSDEFWLLVAQFGWTYHIETGPTPVLYQRDTTALVIINLAKVFKDISLDKSGKKPATFTFRVDIPAKLPKGSIDWSLDGSVDTTLVSKPPKADDGRRTFPVVDIPGGTAAGQTFSASYMVPDWAGFPDASASTHDADAGAYVTATVTFGTPKVKPKVVFELTETHTGGGV